jgi:UDP-N-acetylglucosamine 3-dehydrogenase
MIRYAIPKPEPLLVEHELFRDAAAGAVNDVVTLAQGLRTVEISTAPLESVHCGIALASPRQDFALHGL